MPRKPQSINIGGATRQVARNLSGQQLRDLLTAIMQRPTEVVIQVGCVLRLFFSVIKTGLPTGDIIGGSGSRGGLATVSTTSRRDIGVVAGTPAARRRSSLIITAIEQASAVISTAFKQTKQAKSLRVNGSSGAVKESGGGEKAKQAETLQSWAAKTKRTVPSLLKLLESGATAIGIEHARLIRSHTEVIPLEKAARVSTSAEVCKQGVNAPVVFCWVWCWKRLQYM